MSADRRDRAMAALAMWDGASAVDRLGLTAAELIGGARRHRLIGTLAAAVAAGAIESADGDVDPIRSELVEAMGEVLLLEDVLLDAVDVLDGAGVDHRVLKGSALAHGVYADPSQRSFGDNDLLVAASQLDTAVRTMVHAGAIRPGPPMSRDFDRRFSKSVTLAWRGGTELDLHRTLAPGPFGLRVVLDDLWAEPGVLRLAGRSVRTLPLELHLLSAAYHVALGDVAPRYASVRDLVLLLRSDLDVDRVVELVVRWRGEAVLVEATRWVRKLGGEVGALAQWVDRLVIPARDLTALASYRTRAARFRRQALASLRELGWRDRLAYARALAPGPRRR